MNDELPMYHDKFGRLYHSKHQVPNEHQKVCSRCGVAPKPKFVKVIDGYALTRYACNCGAFCWYENAELLMVQLAAANERIAALEAALRSFVSDTEHGIPGGWMNTIYERDDIHCNYCLSGGGATEPSKVKHDADCPVLVAKALLGEDGQG